MQKTLEKIYSASLHLLEPMSLEETYKTIADEAMRLSNGDYATILLGHRGTLRRVYSTLPKSYKVVPRKQGFTYKVYMQNKPKILSIKAIESIHPQVKRLGIKSDVLIPLSYQNKVIGVLSVLSKRKVFSDDELSLLRHLAPTATLAIKQSQYFEEMKKAIDNRDLFMSMASHELKTPLTSILAYTQMMQRKYEKPSEINPQWISRLNREANRLNKLINELLQVNQIRTGKLNYDWEEHSMNSVIKQAIANFQLNYPDRTVEYKTNFEDSKDKIIADGDKMLQVILNLLINAAKFSEKETPIYINLGDDKNKICISIRDKGQGIPRRDIPHIFEGFYRGENNSHEGMGLGLFLAKQIVDKHKGQMKVKSKINKGTEFEIHLPRKL